MGAHGIPPVHKVVMFTMLFCLVMLYRSPVCRGTLGSGGGLEKKSIAAHAAQLFPLTGLLLLLPGP